MYLGSLTAGASEADLHHIYEFGKNIGIAFQIQDDILDTYGDERVGKKKGGDILQGKKTYLYLKVMSLANDRQKSDFAVLCKSTDLSDEEKVSSVIKVYNEFVVKEYAIQVMEAYKDLAISHINQLHLNEQSKDNLIAFADYMVKRTH